MTDVLLEYACQRIVELEALLLVDGWDALSKSEWEMAGELTEFQLVAEE